MPQPPLNKHRPNFRRYGRSRIPVRLSRFGGWGAMFSDARGEDCRLIENPPLDTQPMITLGRHGHTMLLSPWHVRQLLPHLHAFCATGRLRDDGDNPDDYVI